MSSLGPKREKRWLPNPPRVHYVGLFPVSSFHQLDDQNIFSYSSSRRGEKGTNAISEISFSLFFPHHSPSGMRGGRMNRGIFNIRLNWLILAFFRDSDMYSIHLGFTAPLQSKLLINRIRFRDSAVHHSLQRGGGVLLLWNFQHWQHRFSMLGACGMHHSALAEASFDTSLTFQRLPQLASKKGHHLTGQRLQSMWHIGSFIDIDSVVTICWRKNPTNGKA